MYYRASCNYQVGLSDWAKAGENGAKEYAPNFPYRLRFHPTGQFTFPDTFQQQCQISNLCELRTIPAGSTLFQVGPVMPYKIVQFWDKNKMKHLVGILELINLCQTFLVLWYHVSKAFMGHP